jgi:hypothetical protein
MHREESDKMDAFEKHSYGNTDTEQHDLCELAAVAKAPTMLWRLLEPSENRLSIVSGVREIDVHICNLRNEG